MAVYKERIEGLMSKGGSPTYINITDEVKAIVKKRLQRECCPRHFVAYNLFVFYEEFVQDRMSDGKEPLLQDLENCLEKNHSRTSQLGYILLSGCKTLRRCRILR